MSRNQKMNRALIEGLEGRRMLAGHAMAVAPTMDSSGVVHVVGTEKRDVIVFSVNEDHSKLLVTVNKQTTEFMLADVKGADVDAKGGSDSVKVMSDGFFGGPITVHGGAGNDVIVGTKGDDSLDGGNGNDKISGGDGNDSLSGGKGNDKLDGGNGNDSMEGAAGNDKMMGMAGNDMMVGGAGNDRMVGGEGDDKLDGGGGNDDVNGGVGTDDVTGGGGRDRFHNEDDSMEHKDKHKNDKLVDDDKDKDESEDDDGVPEVKPT